MLIDTCSVELDCTSAVGVVLRTVEVSPDADGDWGWELNDVTSVDCEFWVVMVLELVLVVGVVEVIEPVGFASLATELDTVLAADILEELKVSVFVVLLLVTVDDTVGVSLPVSVLLSVVDDPLVDPGATFD